LLDTAPRSADYLCEACGQHFQQWQAGLEALGIPYSVNARLVRGLDYYTRSVWEVWPPVEGAQSTIGGGGRYDGLAEQLGGRHTPAVGFATGIERLILNLKAQSLPVPMPEALRAYIVYQTAEGKLKALRLAESLRTQGVPADLSLSPRALGKQLAAADKAGARWAVILGEDELARSEVALKDLRNPGSQQTIPEGELLAFLTSDAESPS
jgi:histidyl-tRNA synthetase